MIVSENFEESISDSWSTTRFLCYQCKRLIGKIKTEHFTVIFENNRNLRRIIKIEFENISKSISKWRTQSRKSRSSSNECKWLYWKLHTLGSRPTSYHYINLKILHSSVEYFLYLWSKSMNLIYKENISRF